MVKLFVSVNYKGVIYEPGIAYFDPNYEELLIANGNATFDIESQKGDEEVTSFNAYDKEEDAEDETQQDKNEKEEKPKTTRGSKKSIAKE